jgi:NTP pyrophosphatase (non-canonical NTP hydrolase)
VSEEKRAEIKKEMGDVLWYLAQLSTEFGFPLEDVASLNLEKLASRKERGMLHGSGDNR